MRPFAPADGRRGVHRPTLACIWLGLCGLGGGVCATAGNPGEPVHPQLAWHLLARCAAAYQVNAGISDPARAPAMKRSIEDLSNEYVSAAEAAYQRTHVASVDNTHRAVGAYVARQAKALKGESRAAVERLIESCPQTEG
jgi:hypothetical protein